VLGIDFGDSNGVTWDLLSKGGLIGFFIFSDLCEGLCDFGGADKGSDVGVMAESEDLLAC
jgi:hypothetical protein